MVDTETPFQRFYRVDPSTGLRIQLLDFISIVGAPRRSSSADCSVNLNRDHPAHDLLRDYLDPNGKQVNEFRIFTYDRYGNLMPRRTMWMEKYSGGDLGRGTASFTGHFSAERLNDQILPWIRPGEDTWIPVNPVPLDQLVQACIDRIKAHGGFADLHLVVNGVMPEVATSGVKPGGKFLAWIASYFSDKTIDYDVEEDETEMRLILTPFSQTGRDLRASVRLVLAATTDDVARSIDGSDIGTHLEVHGNGCFTALVNEQALAARTVNGVARPKVISKDRSDIYRQDVCDDYAARLLPFVTETRPNVQHSQIDSDTPDQAVPGEDFDIGDTVTSYTSETAGQEYLPVLSITETVTRSGTRLRADVEVGMTAEDVMPRINALTDTSIEETVNNAVAPIQQQVNQIQEQLDNGGGDGTQLPEGPPGVALLQSSAGSLGWLGGTGPQSSELDVIMGRDGDIQLAFRGKYTGDTKDIYFDGVLTGPDARFQSVTTNRVNDLGIASVIAPDATPGQDPGWVRLIPQSLSTGKGILLDYGWTFPGYPVGNWDSPTYSFMGGPYSIGELMYWAIQNGWVPTGYNGDYDPNPAPGGFMISPTTVTRGQDVEMSFSGWEVPDGTSYRYLVNNQQSSDTSVGTVTGGSGSFTLLDRDFVGISSTSFILYLLAADGTQTTGQAIALGTNAELDISPNTAIAGISQTFTVNTTHSDGTVFIPIWSGTKLDDYPSTVGGGIAYVTVPGQYIKGSGPTLLDIDISGVYHTGITVTVRPPTVADGPVLVTLGLASNQAGNVQFTWDLPDGTVIQPQWRGEDLATVTMSGGAGSVALTAEQVGDADDSRSMRFTRTDTGDSFNRGIPVGDRRGAGGDF